MLGRNPDHPAAGSGVPRRRLVSVSSTRVDVGTRLPVAAWELWRSAGQAARPGAGEAAGSDPRARHDDSVGGPAGESRLCPLPFTALVKGRECCWQP